MIHSNKTKRIFVLAGEASGDLLGGQMLQGIKENADGPVEFIGIGGPTMEAAGLKSLFPMSELSIMGIIEVIKHLPHILKRMKQVENFIRESKPDVIVTIDLPDFSFRIAKRVRDLGIPHVHYIAPSVWAWRPGRAKKISKIIDHLLCIMPFEPPYFTVHGLPCTFVGHMITSLGIESISREKFRADHNIAAEDTLLCLLPGSRRSEIELLLPVFIEAIQRLMILHPTLKIVLPIVDSVKELVRQGLQDFNVPIVFVDNQQERYEAMRASNVALAASGTVNLELAMAQIPFVIGYKANRLTAWLYKKLTLVKYITLVNLLLNRMAVPEFIQEDCTSDNLFKALNNFLNDQKAAQVAVQDEIEAMGMLKPVNHTTSYMAAQVVLEHTKN